jgi:hypothetical protein
MSSYLLQKGRKINWKMVSMVIPQLRMVNPYGKYVTQGFSPDSSALKG